MHVLSVVIFFATVAIFGTIVKAQFCQVKCEVQQDANDNVCVRIDDKEITMSRCDFNNIIHCGTIRIPNYGLKIELVHSGACKLQDKDTCKTTCLKQKKRPVCGQVGNNVTTYEKMCEYLNVRGCREANNGRAFPNDRILNIAPCK